MALRIHYFIAEQGSSNNKRWLMIKNVAKTTPELIFSHTACPLSHCLYLPLLSHYFSFMNTNLLNKPNIYNGIVEFTIVLYRNMNVGESPP